MSKELDLNSKAVEKIRELRILKNLKKVDVAKKINISSSAYNRMEKGEVELTINTLQSIARAINVSIAEILMANNNVYFSGENNKGLQILNNNPTLNIHLNDKQFENLKEILKS